ncbi:hypothetical protein GRI40_08935 [Altererythrobacter aerius]|uniref:DUF5681 domain-containing protein n=1 Tax=Tsuneonella aeria TaxID=1837929 RepID=A0A6I4TFF5_9SPHN|nr:hypothetical protein [Tsuneonella aeria]MXO75336.1 hypothetical protein [Tsuneonella aeria]
MTQPRKNAPTTRGRPFEPGNPGRPKGARHRTTLAIEALLEGEHEKLTRKAVELALGGDTTALRLCLERLAPARKDAPVSVELPRIEKPADAVAASAALIEAVSTGEITPDEAGRVMTLLTAHRTILETAELAARIAALEEARTPRRS